MRQNIWRSKDATVETVKRELGCIGNSHHGHDTCLDGIGNDKIGSVRDAAGHIQADDQHALAANFADGILNITAHQATRQNQGADARKTPNGANCGRQGLLSH